MNLWRRVDVIMKKFRSNYILDFSEPPRPDGTTPARIVRIDPEGIVEVPERSVGFEFECFVEGNPEPRVTWSRGKCNTYLLLLSKINISLLICIATSYIYLNFS